MFVLLFLKNNQVCSKILQPESMEYKGAYAAVD